VDWRDLVGSSPQQIRYSSYVSLEGPKEITKISDKFRTDHLPSRNLIRYLYAEPFRHGPLFIYQLVCLKFKNCLRQFVFSYFRFLIYPQISRYYTRVRIRRGTISQFKDCDSECYDALYIKNVTLVFGRLFNLKNMIRLPHS
jgi:hypothetical protein